MLGLGTGPAMLPVIARRVAGQPLLSALTLSNLAVAETAAAGTLVGTVEGTSPGSTLALADSAGGRFALQGGDIVRGATRLDFETAPNPQITLRETLDGADNSPRETVLTIAVSNAAETPGSFAFTPVNNAPLSNPQVSNTITVSGLAPGDSAPVSLTGGGAYSKNGGTLTMAAGTAVNGDTFYLRRTASVANNTSTSNTLTIGSVSATFTITTVPAAPANTVLPTISGATSVGATLTATTGSWTGSPTGYAYQWLRGGTAIAGATGASYTVDAADLGATVSVQVTASNAGGSAGAVSAGLSIPSMALSNSCILDRSATFTKVGQVSGFSGTPTLTDDAGGRFVITATGEVRVGLVTPDRGIATSHTITVGHAGGSATFPITVSAITPAVLSPRGSIQFPRRNGASAANILASSAGLYGVFGTGNVADGADGAICFFFDVRRGSLVSLSSDTDINSAPYVLGNGTNSVGRGFTCRYFPEDASGQTGTALKGRICFAGKDHTSANSIGQYLGADADGSPSGTGTSGAWLRSAVITDDVPRLVVLRYTKAGATWNGVTHGARTFQVLTIRLDTFAIEYGDARTLPAWNGMGTSSSRTPVLAVGGYGTAAPLAVGNYFPGRISDVAVVAASGSDAQWRAVAQGSPLAAQFAGSVQYHWPLSGPADLAPANDQATAAGAMTITGTVTQGTQMRPTLVGGNGLRAASPGDGYVFGLPVGGTTAAAITLAAVVIGSATHVQARVVRKSDSAVIVDWTRASASASTGMVPLAIPGVPIGFDYVVELRREDDPAIVAISRNRMRVGYKFALVGQSQDHIFLFGSGGPGTGVALPAVSNLSFAVHRPAAQKARKVDVGVLEAVGDMSAGLLAMMERLGALAPTVPWMVQNHCQAGESLASYYSDLVVFSTANGGDGSYRGFGDYVTPGSGQITDLLLTGGKDISFFLHMHGTADSGRGPIYASLLNALYAGVADGNEVFTYSPSQSSASFTTSLSRSYAGAGLAFPTRVAMIPVQRHAFVGTGTVSQSSFDGFRAQYQTLRKNQAEWAPAGSVVATNAGWVHDTALEFYNDTAHQGKDDARGNHRLGRRYALAVLGHVGLSSYKPGPALANATRSGSTITVGFTLPNGGSLFTPDASAPLGFELSEDGGSTWSATGFTAAIAGNTVTLTRTSGTWAAGSQIRYAFGGPVGVFTVNQSVAQRQANFAAENSQLYSLLYESRADAAPGSSSDTVQGVPVIPTFTPLVAA